MSPKTISFRERYIILTGQSGAKTDRHAAVVLSSVQEINRRNARFTLTLNVKINGSLKSNSVYIMVIHITEIKCL